MINHTPVAQLVEQLILNQRVARSIRAGRILLEYQIIRTSDREFSYQNIRNPPTDEAGLVP